MEKTENSLKYFFIVLFANKKLIINITLFFSVFAILTAFLYPPVYRITGSLIVKSKKIQDSPESVRDRVYTRTILPPTNEDVQLETKIITSNDLIRTSVEGLLEKGVSLSMTQSRLQWFIKKIIISPLKSLAISLGLKKEGVVSSVDQLSMEISSNLRTVIIPGSDIIEVQLYDNNPIQGTLALDSIFDNYLKFRRKVLSDPNAGDLFREQTKIYIDEMEQLLETRRRIYLFLKITF